MMQRPGTDPRPEQRPGRRRRAPRRGTSAWLLLGLGLLCVGALGIQAPAAGAAEIVVLGDSWGVLFTPAIQRRLAADGLQGIDVAGLAVGGSTARQWASGQRGDLGQILAGHPDAQVVHVAAGGNDMLGGLADPVSAIAMAVGDVVSLLDQLTAVTQARILFTGYDYLADTLGPLSNQAINLFLDSFMDQVAAGVASLASASQITVLDTHGLMQVHFGVPQLGIDPFDPSLPDPALPGPSTAFRDTIHLTDAGYDVLIEEAFARFYRPLLAPEPPAGWLLLGAAGSVALWRRSSGSLASLIRHDTTF